MFCPKCGTNLPDDAAFCGNCGNRVEGADASADVVEVTTSATEAAPTPAETQAEEPSGLKTNGAGIAAAAIAVVALLFSLMPWFDLSSQMLNLAGIASGFATGASAILGTSTPTIDFQESYAVWGLTGMADAFSSYAQAYTSYGGSQASGAVAFVTGFSWLCLILWIVSLALTVWGAISAFMKGGMAALRAASIFMVITVIAFYGLAGVVGSETGSANVMPVICLILSIVAFCCTLGAKKKA